MPNEDTTLKAEYEQLTRERGEVRRKMITAHASPTLAAQLADIDRRLRRVAETWKKILLVKDRGEVTDDTRLKAVRDLIQRMSARMDIAVITEVRECKNHRFREVWMSSPVATGARSEWDRFVQMTEMELRASFDFIDWSKRRTDRDAERGENDVYSEFSDHPAIVWTIDMHIWDGPKEP
jgi:hypothetical protein